jgi:hypothetical protein
MCDDMGFYPVVIAAAGRMRMPAHDQLSSCAVRDTGALIMEIAPLMKLRAYEIAPLMKLRRL